MKKKITGRHDIYHKNIWLAGAKLGAELSL